MPRTIELLPKHESPELICTFRTPWNNWNELITRIKKNGANKTDSTRTLCEGKLAKYARLFLAVFHMVYFYIKALENNNVPASAPADCLLSRNDHSVRANLEHLHPYRGDSINSARKNQEIHTYIKALVPLILGYAFTTLLVVVKFP